MNNRLPLVSIVIPTYNRKKRLLRLFESIVKSDYPSDKLEIIIVDDASTDGTNEVMEKIKRGHKLKVIYIRNFRERLVSTCKNLGLKKASGKYILFIDDDLVVAPDAIRNLVAYAEKNKSIGIVCPLIYYLNKPDIIWSSGIKIYRKIALAKCIGRGKRSGYYSSPIICDANASIFMVRKECANKVNFNSILFPYINEELDYCLNILNKGYKIVALPSAKTWHERYNHSRTQELFSIRNILSAYYLARNDFIFWFIHNKNFINRMTSFFCVIIHSFTRLFLTILIDRDLHIFKSYTKGMINGIRIVAYMDFNPEKIKEKPEHYFEAMKC